MKVLITLLLAVLICARKVVDPITMEIRMEPKTVDILMKQLINDIQQRNSTSEKFNKEKYESIIRSLQAKIVNEKGNIAESLKELKVLQNKRSAYVTIKKSTSSIDDEIKTTKNSIAIKEKLIKGIQKQIHHVKKALQHNKKVWIQQQAIHLKTLRSLEKRKEKVNNLQEVIDLVNIKNNASNILSQEFIDAIVCGGKEERRAYFFMKEKTDKNSEKLLHMLIKAKDLAEQLIKPSTQTVISNKYNVSMKHAISRRDKAVANVARLQKKLYTLNKQILDVSNECNIASGSIQKSCLKKQYKLQEKRKQLKNVVRRAKSLKIQASLDVSNIQTRISAEVSKISKDQTIEARKKVSDWLQKSDAQMKKARSIAALMSKEEVSNALQENAVVDRIINLRQRRKQVYEKMASVLHKEEKAINSHINILSNAGDKLEKAALKFAKYEAKGALVDKKSESLKVEANEKRSLAADQADEMIVKWRSIVSQENKDIYQLEKKEKQLLKRIEELKDGVMKLTTNITIATLMDEIEEGKTIIKQKTELLRVLNDMIKRMVERSLGKSSVMRKAALARLIELKKYKVDVKKK
ncbi:myosin heavy chain [Entamoeba marina]